MHRLRTIGLLGFCLVMAATTVASAAGATNIAYVDLQRTLNETAYGKKAKKKLNSDKAKKQKALDKKQKELQKYVADLDKQRAVLKPAVLRKRERELQERYVKLQEMYLKLQQDLAKEEAKLIQEIFAKAAPIIESIAKKRGYHMILEKNESAVLWAVPAADITSEVNKRLK